MLPNDSHPHLETVSRASLSNSSTLWRVYSTEWIFCFQSFSVCQLTRKVCLSLSLKSCQDFLQIPVNLGTTLTPLLCSLFTLLFHCLTPWYSGEAESPQSIMFCCTWAFLLQSLFFFFFWWDHWERHLRGKVIYEVHIPLILLDRTIFAASVMVVWGNIVNYSPAASPAEWPFHIHSPSYAPKDNGPTLWLQQRITCPKFRVQK